MSNEEGRGIECLNCNSKIYSRSRHNMRYCKCEDCYVDGGSSYLRFGYKSRQEVAIIDKDGNRLVQKANRDD